jgi:uncharacterized coiled-coil protein SlyX
MAKDRLGFRYTSSDEQHISELERQLAEANAEIARLREALAAIEKSRIAELKAALRRCDD